MTIDSEVQDALIDFHKAGKYIGVGQNSTILIAKCLGE